MKFVSRSMRGFYSLEIHGKDMPDDVVAISDEDYSALLRAQSEGLIIDWSGELPVAVSPPPLTLTERSARQLSAITAERDRREAGAFQYRGRAIDCDPRAVQRITTAAMAAQAALAAGKPFALDWTCADNSVLPLDAAGVIGMPLALAAHADALHQHARMLKQQVMVADDEAALSAIDIYHGWPGDAV